jgi:hypothetical protein
MQLWEHSHDSNSTSYNLFNDAVKIITNIASNNTIVSEDELSGKVLKDYSNEIKHYEAKQHPLIFSLTLPKSNSLSKHQANIQTAEKSTGRLAKTWNRDYPDMKHQTLSVLSLKPRSYGIWWVPCIAQKWFVFLFTNFQLTVLISCIIYQINVTHAFIQASNYISQSRKMKWLDKQALRFHSTCEGTAGRNQLVIGTS